MSELAHYRFHPCSSGPGADEPAGNYDKHVHLAAVPAQTGRIPVCRWIQVWFRVQLRPLLLPPAHLARPELLNRFFTDALGTRNRLKPNHCGLNPPPTENHAHAHARLRVEGVSGAEGTDRDWTLTPDFRIHYFFLKQPLKRPKTQRPSRNIRILLCLQPVNDDSAHARCKVEPRSACTSQKKKKNQHRPESQNRSFGSVFPTRYSLS